MTQAGPSFPASTFVINGGIAGRLWGSPTVTNDLDICYPRDRANLKALTAARDEMEADS